MSQILSDGSLMVEEEEIMVGSFYLTIKVIKEWEFVNKDENDNIGQISWSRIIENPTFVKKYKSLNIRKN